MPKKAIIFDLDNTIYPVHSIGDTLFAPLFNLIFQEGNFSKQATQIKKEIMRRPFQYVAQQFGFGEALTKAGNALLQQTVYAGPIAPFEDYSFTQAIKLDKFLVTTGYTQLQQSKIDGMKINDDFKAIYIVDPQQSSLTKKDVFLSIIQTYGYTITELLVVGDDLHSEIKAAHELGIDAVLYDRLQLHTNEQSFPVITHFNQLEKFL
ncbi:MAG: HAD family hydrolase [Bacteroidetes bacterium]|nr:HAD family hydrolase [Bacteroidota bacterium]